jgi:hypothetical protein
MGDLRDAYTAAQDAYDNMQAEMERVGQSLEQAGKTLRMNPGQLRFPGTCFSTPIDQHYRQQPSLHVEQSNWRSFDQMQDLLNRYYRARFELTKAYEAMPDDQRRSMKEPKY